MSLTHVRNAITSTRPLPLRLCDVFCQVLLLLFRWYQRNSRKSFNFDNPVYRHTTTSQFMVLQPKSLSSVSWLVCVENCCAF